MIKKIIDFEQILRGCQKNEIGAKELLYKRFYGYLKAVIFRYTANSLDGEELVNDSFIKIFNHIHQFLPAVQQSETEKLFKSWAAKIASRTAIDRLRANKQLHLHGELPEEEHPVAPVSVISPLYVADIFSLINQLPELQRMIFNLYEVEGFAHHEIAKLLQIAESSSRVYLTRAKNKLRLMYLQSLKHPHEKNG